MTREEAIAILDGFKYNPLLNEQHFEALDMAISALSAEPCDDCISRQAVLDGIAEWIVSGYADSEADCSHISSLVTHLPSVENKGEWIADVDKWGDVVTTVNGYTCSKCGAFNSDKDNFCPNCGAYMRGE